MLPDIAAINVFETHDFNAPCKKHKQAASRGDKTRKITNHLIAPYVAWLPVLHAHTRIYFALFNQLIQTYM